MDVAITLRGNHPGITQWILLQAFFSRFAVGLLAATVDWRIHPVAAGAIVGLVVSLPDAFALRSFAGILGTGLLFGAIAGWAAQRWGA